MGWGGALVAALVVVLTRPVTWVLGLAGFLARGGIVLLALPVTVLPTPSGVQNALGGPVSSVLFGAPSAGLLLLVGVLAAGGVLLLVAGTLAGAWAERAGICIALEAAADEALLEGAVPVPRAGMARIAVVRLLGLVPVAVLLLLSLPTIYAVGYRELILPEELRTPLLARILVAAPGTFAALAVAWFAGDAAASAAVRRLVFEPVAVPAAWLLGWWDLVRWAPRMVATGVLGLAFFGALVAPGALAAVLGWARVRETFMEGRDPVAMVLAVVLWVAAWLGALVLAGLASALRNAAWTFTALRRG